MTAPRRLFLLRHAKATAHTAPVQDHARRLHPHGIEEARHLAEMLQQEQFAVDEILSSDSARTQETVAQQALWAGQTPVCWLASMYHAQAQDLLQIVRGLSPAAARVMLVGHNPGIHLLCAQLVGDGPPKLREKISEFATCTLAEIELPGAWEDADWGCGTLMRVITP